MGKTDHRLEERGKVGRRESTYSKTLVLLIPKAKKKVPPGEGMEDRKGSEDSVKKVKKLD